MTCSLFVYNLRTLAKGRRWADRRRAGRGRVTLVLDPAELPAAAACTTPSTVSSRTTQMGGAAPLDLAVQRLPALVADPTLEEAAIAAIAELYPEVGDKRLRGIVRDLRDTGSARFPRPYLHENRPMAVALCPGLDIFFPVGCANPEDATVAFRVEYMDPNDLRAMVTVNKWDEEWAQKAMATASTSYGDLKSGQRRRPRNTSTRSEPTVEIVHVYERTVDEDGVEGVEVAAVDSGRIVDQKLLDFQPVGDLLQAQHTEKGRPHSAAPRK